VRLTIGVIITVAAGVLVLGQAAQGPARSVADGVYTTEQAARGRAQYRKRCVLCHRADGQGQRARPVIPGESLEREGDAEAPSIAGEAFLARWNGRTVKELFDTLAATMPPGSAGSLKPQEHADLLAYVFEMNKLPAGAADLPVVPDELARITIAAPAAK
jgi:cytochrome c